MEDGDDIGRLLKEKWGYYPWCCYLTEDKKQGEYNGIQVYTYEEAIVRYEQLDIVIGSVQSSIAARDKMAAHGTRGECINLGDITETLERQQYFDFFEYSGEKETFVDGGVYDLGSVAGFLKWCNGNYERVFAFEPEKSNYELCKEKAEQWENVSLFNCGLLDRQGKIGFTSGLGGASRIEDQQQDFYSDYDISVTDLDSVIQEEKVTFIKMDIEGAEFEVIHDIICDGIEFGQLCIEVHDRFFENGDKRLKDLMKELHGRGYVLASADSKLQEFTFIKG